MNYSNNFNNNNSPFSKRSFFSQENIDNLKQFSHCTYCNSQYHPNQAKVIDEAGDSFLVYIQCKKCQGSVVALVYTGMNGITAINVLTDLTEEEVTKFKNSKGMTINKVLNLYTTLENNEMEEIFIKQLSR